jgi:hypothetical protein
MKILTYLCALLLVAVGWVAYRWPEILELEPQEWTVLAPAAVGAGMLLGAFLSHPFRRFGIHLAMLAAFVGIALSLGRLAPDYINENLDWQEPYARMLCAIAVVCASYWVFGAVWMWIPKRATD